MKYRIKDKNKSDERDKKNEKYEVCMKIGY